MDFSKHIQKAEEALRRRNYDFAVELFRQLVDLDPDQFEARRGLRTALKKRAEAKRGGKFLRAVSGALPLSRAKTMHKLGKHAACARALEDYLASQPLDEEANLLLGQSLEESGAFNGARAVYEYLAEIAPKNSEGLKRAGAMMQRAGEHGRALEYFERALAADPRDQEALKARKNLAAETALQRSSGEGHSREAIVDKGQAISLERRQRLHLSAEELAEEIERLEGQLADSPSDPDLMMDIAGLHEKNKDPEAALDFAERALQYRKDAFDWICRVGDLKGKVLKKRIAKADKAGETERAGELERELQAFEVEDYRRRVEIRPGDAGLRLQLARKLLREGELDGAVGELQKCRNDPRAKADALFLMGQCFQRKGIMDLARKEYEEALNGRENVDERAKEILYNLGAIAEAEEDRAQARAFYIRIYEVDIGYRDVATKMGELS